MRELESESMRMHLITYASCQLTTRENEKSPSQREDEPASFEMTPRSHSHSHSRSQSRQQQTIFILCILAIGFTITLIISRALKDEINIECCIDNVSLWPHTSYTTSPAINTVFRFGLIGTGLCVFMVYGYVFDVGLNKIVFGYDLNNIFEYGNNGIVKLTHIIMHLVVCWFLIFFIFCFARELTGHSCA